MRAAFLWSAESHFGDEQVIAVDGGELIALPYRRTPVADQ